MIKKIDKLWEIQKDLSWLKKSLIGNGKRGIFGDITQIKIEIENFKSNYVSYKQLLGFIFGAVALLVALIGAVNYVTMEILK